MVYPANPPQIKTKTYPERASLYLKVGDEVRWDSCHYGRVISCASQYPDLNDTICVIEKGTNEILFKLRKELLKI